MLCERDRILSERTPEAMQKRQAAIATSHQERLRQWEAERDEQLAWLEEKVKELDEHDAMLVEYGYKPCPAVTETKRLAYYHMMKEVHLSNPSFNQCKERGIEMPRLQSAKSLELTNRKVLPPTGGRDAEIIENLKVMVCQVIKAKWRKGTNLMGVDIRAKPLNKAILAAAQVAESLGIAHPFKINDELLTECFRRAGLIYDGRDGGEYEGINPEDAWVHMEKFTSWGAMKDTLASMPPASDAQ